MVVIDAAKTPTVSDSALNLGSLRERCSVPGSADVSTRRQCPVRARQPHGFSRRSAPAKGPLAAYLQEEPPMSTVTAPAPSGPTECCVFSTRERLTDPPHVTPNRGLVSIGIPLPGFEAAVIDDSCTPVPRGQQGELALAGPQVAKGYFQDAVRTAERFP